MTSMNSVKPSDRRVNVLLELSKSLLHASADLHLVQESLQVLCRSMDDSGAALYRRHCTDDDSYELIQIASAWGNDELTSSFPEKFTYEEIDSDSWKMLNTEVPACFSETNFDRRIGGVYFRGK